MTKQKLAHVAGLADGQTVKFQFPGATRPREGFLARFRGHLVAYENRCRHLPVKLDAEGDGFFSPSRDYLVCHAHLATYDPLTGLCVRGPCEGESLVPLRIEVVDGEVWLILD